MTPRASGREPAPPEAEAADYRVFTYTAEGPNALPSVEGYDLRVWSPSWRRLIAPTMGLRSLEWWLWVRLGRQGMGDYRVFLLSDGGQVIHRSCALPACPRWPFMGARDIHVCMTWTDPAYRGRGLATLVLATLVRTMAIPGRRFWYLARPRNAASIAVCTKAGFVPHGLAGYRRLLGLPLRIVLTSPEGLGRVEREEEVTPV